MRTGIMKKFAIFGLLILAFTFSVFGQKKTTVKTDPAKAAVRAAKDRNVFHLLIIVPVESFSLRRQNRAIRVGIVGRSVEVNDLPFLADLLKNERHPARSGFELAVIFLLLFPFAGQVCRVCAEHKKDDRGG